MTIVETVGVGQAELDIMGLADTVIVAVVPEGGDAMQAMKAGLMEIADLFVVNKADRPGADAVVRDISAVISWDTRPREWVPRVLSTKAVEGVGIDTLVDAIVEHKGASEQSGLLARRRSERRKRELFEAIRNHVDREAQTVISSNPNPLQPRPPGRIRRARPPYRRPNRPSSHPPSYQPSLVLLPPLNTPFKTPSPRTPTLLQQYFALSCLMSS